MTVKNDLVPGDRSPDTDKSVHLSASAGSGKTRALKERYLALLDRLERNGLGIDQAVALTFTDKAAAEIKERVLQGLPESTLKKIIRGREDLRISTIHSFCMNLLKRYPLEAGLPPDFGVLDSRDQANKVRRAVEETLEESDRDPDIMLPLRDFSADSLVRTIEFLFSIRNRIKRMEIDAGGAGGLLQSLRSGMGADRATDDANSLVKGREWRMAFQRMEELLRLFGDQYDRSKGREHLLLSQATDASSASGLAGSLSGIYFTREGPPRKNPFISKKASGPKNRESYERAYAELQDLLGRFRELYARMHAGLEAFSLLKLFSRAEDTYQLSKLREGVLDFDDLEIYAYHLLRSLESPDILYWLDRKVLHFLVDEFQDTSDIQWAILERLTEELFAGLGADKPMRPTLFVVGDAKQSIYRFREANYRLIEQVRRKMEASLPPGSRSIRTLDRNYRSTPQVIEVVNRVFIGLWKEAYQPSDTERSMQTGSVRFIEVRSDAPDGSSGPSEADVLAQEINALVEQGTVVYENDGNVWKERRAGYGDCAVLLQSRTRLKEYEAALRKAGVPFRVVGGIGFYEEDEVQALLNTLFFLRNRSDRLALAAALKSPLFGLIDRDLAEIFTAPDDALAVLKKRHPDAGALFENWSRYAGAEPLAGLLHRIVLDTGAYLRFGRLNPQALFNIDKLLDTAREFDRRGYTMLQDFVAWVRDIREAEQREATADLNLPGFEGAISIMTVHKAKGLEFPIVLLPGMNQRTKSLSDGPRVIIEADGGVVMAVRDKSNPLYRDLWERERTELLREHQRLFYVAMTRARDHLVMLGSVEKDGKPAGDNTWLGYLCSAFPALAEREGESAAGILSRSWPDWRPQQLHRQYGRSDASQQRHKRSHDIASEKLLANLLPLAPSDSWEWKKATDFISQDPELLAENAAQQNNVSPLTRGSVLHRCLEEKAKQGAYDLERIVNGYPEIRVLERDAVERFVKEARSVLDLVLSEGALAWIFECAGNAYSELPFLYKRGTVLVSGIVDRVIIRNGTGYVIDYKAILADKDETVKAWSDHYRPQVQVYCEAVQQLFGLDQVEGYLLYLDNARLVLTTKV